MALALLMALQAAAPPGPSEPPVGVDLARVPSIAEIVSGRRCGEGREGTEIVVCAQRPVESQSPEEAERRFREDPLRAEIGIAPGVTLRGYGDSATMAGGLVSKRAMVGVKLRF